MVKIPRLRTKIYNLNSLRGIISFYERLSDYDITQAQLVLKTIRVICSGRLTRTKVIHIYEAKVIKLIKLTKVNATLKGGS